jgi:hypothetical protein
MIYQLVSERDVFGGGMRWQSRENSRAYLTSIEQHDFEGDFRTAAAPSQWARGNDSMYVHTSRSGRWSYERMVTSVMAGHGEMERRTLSKARLQGRSRWNDTISLFLFLRYQHASFLVSTSRQVRAWPQLANGDRSHAAFFHLNSGTGLTFVDKV